MLAPPQAKIRAIETRAAELCGVPPDNVEPLQVVAYRDGQQFKTHHDAGTLSNPQRNRRNRRRAGPT